VAEAMLKIEKEKNIKVDILVMIQGDEPMVSPQMIEESIVPLRRDKNVNVVNLMAPIKTPQEFNDPNTIKVVVDKESNALYFSRVPIPSRNRVKDGVPMYKQVCIIPFRRDYLLKFNNLEQTPLEKVESVDMLRVLENGEKVRMVLTDHETFSVDTEEDLRKVSALMEHDTLFRTYK
jgi:3-deoxy-manno-octulosonate cytidylyltransferase (CMP-KDO synthetase)